MQYPYRTNTISYRMTAIQYRTDTIPYCMTTKQYRTNTISYRMTAKQYRSYHFVRVAYNDKERCR